MLGFSYGEIFLLLGATAALIGPKDLPIIARTAGRLAGRAIGYVQLTRGQFETVLQKSQARQVHKELQDAMAQLDAIRHEIRSISMINPGPLARTFVDNPDHPSNLSENRKPENPGGESNSVPAVAKDSALPASHSTNMHSQATTYAKLAEFSVTKNGLSASSNPDHPSNLNENRKPENPGGEINSVPAVAKDSALPASHSTNMHSQATTYAKLAEFSATKNGLSASSTEVEGKDESQLMVLPVSAEDTGLIPKRGADVKGSDIVLEAILEAEVAHNAKEFFSQPQNQI